MELESKELGGFHFHTIVLTAIPANDSYNLVFIISQATKSSAQSKKLCLRHHCLIFTRYAYDYESEFDFDSNSDSDSFVGENQPKANSKLYNN